MNKSSMASTNENTASHTNGDDANQLVEQAKRAVTHVASDVADRAVSQANTLIDGKRDKAVETMGSVATALRETGEKLKGVGPLADVAGQAADGVEKFVDFFEGKQIRDVVRDVEQFARREPALFIGGAFAAGLIAGRFLKSSGHRVDSENGGGIAVDGVTRDHRSKPGGTLPAQRPQTASGSSANVTPRLPPKSPSVDSTFTATGVRAGSTESPTALGKPVIFNGGTSGNA